MLLYWVDRGRGGTSTQIGANAHTITYGKPDSYDLVNCHPDSDAITELHSFSYTNHADFHANPDRYCDRHTHLYAYRNADANQYQYADADGYKHAKTNRYAGAYQHANADIHADRNSYQDITAN